jgi:hypothetical protein
MNLDRPSGLPLVVAAVQRSIRIEYPGAFIM